MISTPRGVGWEVQSRVVSTETKAADGGIERETIKYEQPGYAAGGTSKIKPRLKIVEKYVVGDGGRASMDRRVYVRDVNNRWVPQTFSSKIPGRGAYERRE